MNNMKTLKRKRKKERRKEGKKERNKERESVSYDTISLLYLLQCQHVVPKCDIVIGVLLKMNGMLTNNERQRVQRSLTWNSKHKSRFGSEISSCMYSPVSVCLNS